jgi:single-stranded-DNA-specific exonuclease
MKWIVAPIDAREVASLASALRISAPTARVLCARGFGEPAAARRFLSPTPADLHDPFLLAGMAKAAARLAQAVARKEPILLYGDYDVDGTSALVVLKKTLDLAGGNATCFVPHRIKDGYGMKSDAVEEAASQGVKLIVSVDTGIRANAVVEHAAGLGIDVIVTDHHLPDTELPPALAVLNPNRPDCAYPEKNLCGAGVALKLAEGLMTELGWPVARREKIVDSLLKLVAIATVADVVPLTGENRVIVKRGLEGLRNLNNPGLRALLTVSGIAEGAAPSAREVAFQIGPRINAAGRMASASDVIELFTTNDVARAQAIAAQLDELNKDRRETEEQIRKDIEAFCLAQPVTEQDAALVFAGEGWHRGVVGIVASRVVERFHRPAFVLGLEEGMAYGSGRSIRAFHLLDALESMPELFDKFGGHRQAAGVTMQAVHVETFRERLRTYASTKLTLSDFEGEIEIDAEINFSEVTDQCVAELLNLAPFGFGNPPPTFVARGVEVSGPPDTKKEKHLFLRLFSRGRTLRAKAWNFASRAEEFSAQAPIDVALQFEDDAYSAARGYAPWQTIIRDVKAVAARAAV